MDDDQQFCLRWNNHQSTLVSVFDTLLEKGMHVDCTLAAEGQTLKAHKVVLSACSPYFESVLSQQYDKHPIIILKDVKYAELRAMMDYMYRGEVNISQDQLAALLKAAESLQIKGLSDNKPSRPASHAAPPAASDATVQQPRSRAGSAGSAGSAGRAGSASPSRRRKRPRRSAEPQPAASPPPPAAAADCKQEPPRDTVEDLTIDEDADDPPPTTQNDVVRNFQWHMERSQDEIMNSSDSVRDSQELQKDDALPSALLTLLSAQRAALLRKPEPSTEMFPALHMPKLNALIPENIKAHLLQQAFLNNNQGQDYKGKDDTESDAEYDDTDDIVLPEESETYYEANSFSPNTSVNSDDALDSKSDIRSQYGKRDGNSSDDSTRQFECKHCGKKYRWKSTLRRHENVECGGKAPSHQCPYCSYKAKQRGNLGVHIRKHHNNEWYIYASNRVRRNKKTPI